jgi:hypothetical protein
MRKELVEVIGEEGKKGLLETLGNEMFKCSILIGVWVKVEIRNERTDLSANQTRTRNLLLMFFDWRRSQKLSNVICN